MIKADKTPPTITFEEEVLTVNLEEEFSLLQGVTAYDKESGDITDRVQVVSASKIVEGERTVKYVVFDDANLSAIAERKVVYANYVPPRIYINTPLRCDISAVKEGFELQKVTAKDIIDGDITDKIKITLDYAEEIKPGTYPIALQVNNSAGDTCAITIEISVLAASAEAGKFYPELSDYILYTPVGTELNLRSYLTGLISQSERYVFGSEGTPANINADSVQIESSVDYLTPGTYKVNYSYTTRSNVTAVTTAYVVVEG